ncbi:hypothetical protein GIB67_007117, partial [Kingdonia uniflora]
YTMNEKMPPTSSNRRKIELAREEDLLTYKIKGKTIDPSTVVPPATVDTTNEGTKSAQAALGAQPPLPNISPDSDVNIPIVEGNSEGEGATSNEDVGLSDKSLLKSFRFYRARLIALGQDLTKEPQEVQDFVKLKGLDRIGAISYNYYNSARIFSFAKRWQPKTNSFYFKWGEMTPTQVYVEQLVGLPADGDATVIEETKRTLCIQVGEGSQ